MKAARRVSSSVRHAVLGHQDRHAGGLVGVADGAAQGERLDGAAHLVERRAGGRRRRAVAVVRDALVVLHPDEVVVAGQLQPALVDLGPLAVAHGRVVAVHDVVDDRERQADRAGRRGGP